MGNNKDGPIPGLTKRDAISAAAYVARRNAKRHGRQDLNADDLRLYGQLLQALMDRIDRWAVDTPDKEE